MRRQPEPLSPALRVEKAVKAFNTWSFKREQPSSTEVLTAVVERAVLADRPIPFILYWGKGPRVAVAAPDRVCLDYLKSMADRIAAVHPAGASVRLILTDTHARLNGHGAAAIDGYFGDIDTEARVRGFSTRRLSDIVEHAPPASAEDIAALPTGAVHDSLVACAAKWYRGEGSTEQGALDYYRLNMIERRAIEALYPDAIFVTFNNSEFRELFPARLPIFYMYSLKRGFGVKPWFMTAEEPARGLLAKPGPEARAPSTGTAQ